MRVLGFSVGHDKGAVIIEDGKVMIGITQERFKQWFGLKECNCTERKKFLNKIIQSLRQFYSQRLP